MPVEWIIKDYGTPGIVANKMFESAAAAIDMSSVVTEIVFDLFRIEKIMFESEGRRGGGSWKRLAPATVAKKGGTEILRTEGSPPGYGSGRDLLFRSLTVLGAPYQNIKVKNDFLEFGTKRPYARVHQYGSTARKIPARPFLRFTKNDYERWERMIENHLTKAFKAGTKPKV
jgi:phage gpG-like protein